MRTNDAPAGDHLPCLLSGTENAPIVFGADGLRFRVKSVGIGRNQPEQICHDEPILTPCSGKGPDASKCRIELGFICEAWIEADPRAQPWCGKRLPRVHKPISITSIKTEDTVVLHGVSLTCGHRCSFWTFYQWAAPCHVSRIPCFVFIALDSLKLPAPCAFAGLERTSSNGRSMSRLRRLTRKRT
jgi:hypothetical protein